MENEKHLHLKPIISLMVALILIIGLLWHTAKNITISEAQELNSKEEFVWRTIDTSSAQEDAKGCGKLI